MILLHQLKIRGGIHIIVFFIPHHKIVAGYYGFRLDVRMSVRLSVVQTPLRFSFLDDNLSKHQWILTKLGMCIHIMEIWFGIVNGQISSNSYGDVILAGYYSLTFLCPRIG